MAKAAPTSPSTKYVIQACATPAGQIIAAPNTSYYFDRKQAVLFEIDNGSGDGAEIINGWTDEQGQYFFVWVGNGPGWQYFFPNDQGKPAIRLNYEAGTYSGDRSTPGVVRPVGTPSSTCVMQKG